MAFLFLGLTQPTVGGASCPALCGHLNQPILVKKLGSCCAIFEHNQRGIKTIPEVS